MDDKNKYEMYTASKLTEFRKSISQMGTTVANGNVFLDPTKGRREPKLDIETIINPEIIKTIESKPSYGYYHSEPQYSYWQLKNMWRK